MVGQIPFFRSPSPQKQKAFTAEGSSLYKGIPQLLQQIPKAFTAEGASTYLRKPQHLHEKQTAFTGEDESLDSRRRPALDSQKYSTYCKKPIKCLMKN